MAVYSPPNYTQPLSIFNPANYSDDESTITKAYLDANYLKFPVAQAGTETLNNVVINGTANLNGALTVTPSSSFKSSISLDNTSSIANRTLNTSYINFYNSAVASPLTTNGRLENDGGTMKMVNDTNNGIIRFTLRDAGGVSYNPFELLTTSNVCNRILTMNGNNNINFASGTGIINQPIVTGDGSTSNALRKTSCSIANISSNGSGTSALDVIDNTSGRGLFVVPSAENGVLGDTSIRGDCVIGSRIQNGGSLCFSNWNFNLRNGLRIFTTDISNCGLTLQCGQNSTSDWSELRMAYNRGTNTTATTFNNVINFNPTTPFAINSSRRQLTGLGTLSFTDISGNNTTDGALNSRIWTDSSFSWQDPSLTIAIGAGMFYDCSMGGTSNHIFRVSDTSGNKINALTVNSTAITARESLNFASTSISERNINNVGTLNFLDLSGNTTQGTTVSNIFTDSSLVDGIGGMYYQNNINNGFHIFRTRSAGGVLTSPIFYGSTLSSFSNTLVVRNATTTSNRLDISYDNGVSNPTATIRARTTNTGANSKLIIQTETVDASGVVSTLENCNFQTFALELKRPIQFALNTAPFNSTQLGFFTDVSLGSVSIASQSGPSYLGSSLSLGVGSWIITALLEFIGSGNHNLTTFEYGIGTAPFAMTTTMPYLLSYMREQGVTLNTSTKISRQVSLNLRLASTTTIYFNEYLSWSGGGTTTVTGVYSYGRIG